MMRESNVARTSKSSSRKRAFATIPNDYDGKRFVRQLRAYLNGSYRLSVRGTHRLPSAKPCRGFTPLKDAQSLNLYLDPVNLANRQMTRWNG